MSKKSTSPFDDNPLKRETTLNNWPYLATLLAVVVAVPFSTRLAFGQPQLPAAGRSEINPDWRTIDVLDSKPAEQEPELVSVLENRKPVRNEKPEAITPPELPSQFIVSPELNQLLTGIVLDNMPHQYEKKKNWGKQVKRWAGVELRRDDGGRGKLETQRKFKLVNHGTWQKYGAELVDPGNQFSVGLSDVSRNPEGLTSFDVNFSTNLKINGRQSKWINGVQLYSLSVDGHARIRLRISCELDTGIDFSHFPPDLIFQPYITDARISVDKFKIDRFSKAGGEIAIQLTKLARKELDTKVAEKERELVKKLNQKIAENQDKLRLSTSDAVRLKWYNQTKEFLPETVKSTLEK